MISIKNTDTDFVIELDLGNVCNYKCNYCFPGANEGTVLWPDIDKIEAALLNYIKQHQRKTRGSIGRGDGRGVCARQRNRPAFGREQRTQGQGHRLGP